MDNKTVYTTKAEAYARHRWDYAPQAVQMIVKTAGINTASIVADVGSGTGMLTHHFTGKVRQLIAIEPNLAMQRAARRLLSGQSGCLQVLAYGEALPLPAHSVDLITVAQAIHWLNAKQARQSFRRVLKPGGWLAILRNYGTDAAVYREIEKISTPENGVTPPDPSRITPDIMPIDYFYQPGCFEKKIYPFVFQQNWGSFIGALVSASYNPDESHPLYCRFEEAARGIFEHFSSGDRLEVHGETELYIGQIA